MASKTKIVYQGTGRISDFRDTASDNVVEPENLCV